MKVLSMPKIAQYQPNQVQTQVVPQPRASASVPSAAFGGPIAKGMMDLAKAGAALSQRVDTTSAEEALVQFERDKNDLFFNTETGYFNTQGRNAYDGSVSATKALEELKVKYGDALNTQAKLMFDRAADRHVASGQVDISRHASKGFKAWEVATMEAQVENSIENASLYWNDPHKLKVQKELGRQSVMDSAEMQGIGAEATAENLQTFDSSFAKTAIEAAVQNSASEGKKALKEYGDMLEGPFKVQMKAKIDAKAKSEKNQYNAQQAVLTATNLTTKYDNRADIIAEVDKIKDPDLRKQTMSEAMSQYSRREQARKEQANDSYNEAIGMVNQGLTHTQIAAQNPEAWEGMTDLQRNNIQSGKHMITDQIEYNRVMALPQNELIKVDVNDLSGKVNPKDLRKIATKQNNAKKFEPDVRAETFSKKLNKAAQNAFPGKWKQSKSGKATPRGEKADALMKDIRDAVTQFQADNNRKITPTEEDAIIGEFTREIVIERSAFGLDILASDVEIDLSNTPAKDVRVLNRIINATPDVDLNDLTDAYQFLIDNGQTVTADNLRSVYSQGRQ